jgi:hypothetical protein
MIFYKREQLINYLVHYFNCSREKLLYDYDIDITEVYSDNKKMYIPIVKKKKWYKRIFKKGK